MYIYIFYIWQVGFLQYLNSMVLTVVPWYLVCFLAWFTTVLLLILRKKNRPYNTRRNDDINKVVVTIFFLCVIAMLSFLPSLIAFFFHEEYRVLATDNYPSWVWYFCVIYSPALSSFFNPIVLILRGRGMWTTLKVVIVQWSRCRRVNDQDIARGLSFNPTTRFDRNACSVQLGGNCNTVTKSTAAWTVNGFYPKIVFS